MPTPNQLAEAASKAGITTNADGTRYVPSSVRSDGSVRKEIKVKPGYRPPEDVEVYKNRAAESWKNRGKGGVPGAESVDSAKGKESGSASKNAKRREARKKAAAEKGNDDDADPDDQSQQDAAPIKLNGTGKWAKDAESADSAATADAEAEKQKEAKKLVKKLRQARELKDKKDQGSALLPEQFAKVIRINELIRQLDSMGFDVDGEKKVEGGDGETKTNDAP
jgi:partner of Y14 and mago protein